MNFFNTGVTILAVLLLLHASTVQTKVKNVEEITAYQLKQHLDAQDALLIDVRQPAEHRAEHIPGDILIPLSQISVDLLPSTAKPIIIYCRSGRRSAEAAAKLLQENPNLTIKSLKNGIVTWHKAGFEVIETESSILPLDRQTQIAAGSLAFGGFLLGTFVNPGFYAVSGFVGAGLIFAGLTGWCTMSKILAWMPWNQ